MYDGSTETLLYFGSFVMQKPSAKKQTQNKITEYLYVKIEEALGNCYNVYHEDEFSIMDYAVQKKKKKVHAKFNKQST